MLSPSTRTRIYIQMTKGTSVSSCQRLSGKALLLLNMSFVRLLMNCFLTSWTFLVILAIRAFTNEVRSQSTDLNTLIALTANNEHRTGIIVVHIFVVFWDESFIMPFAKLAILLFILKLIRLFLRNLDELIPHLHLHRLRSTATLRTFRFDWLLVEIVIFLRSPRFIKFVLNWFDYRRSQVFNIGLKFTIPNLSSNWTKKVDSPCSHIIALIISVFNCVLHHRFIIVP